MNNAILLLEDVPPSVTKLPTVDPQLVNRINEGMNETGWCAYFSFRRYFN